VTCGFGGALGGTRTPNLLIRRLCHAHPLPALAESLNAFNGLYLNHADHDEPGSAFAHSIGEVTRRATAVAIFTLGITQRLHLTAQQN
jgi:hypothetical protein